MYCIKCGNLIPQARLKALPTAKTCVHCSQAQRVAGFPLITGKTEYAALQYYHKLMPNSCIKWEHWSLYLYEAREAELALAIGY